MKAITVVVDEGSAQTKACWIEPESGELKTHTIQSMVKEGDWETDMIGNLQPNNYRVDGTEYYASASIDNPATTKRKTYQTSDENLVLVHEVLRQAGFGGQDVNLIVTLPISQYFLGDGYKPDADQLDAKKSNVMRDIESPEGVAELARIVKCNVAPEGIPGWYNMLINDNGELDEARADFDSVMIVDIGGTTTDVGVISGEGNIRKRTSIDIGVFDLYQDLTKRVMSETHINSVPRRNMDSILRHRVFRKTDMSAFIEAAAKSVCNAIRHKMDEFEHDPHALDAILYVGGGSSVFGRMLAEKYGNVENSHINEDADLQTAKGLVRYTAYTQS